LRISKYNSSKSKSRFWSHMVLP